MKRPAAAGHLFHTAGVFATRGPAVVWLAAWALLLAPGLEMPELGPLEFLRVVPIALLFSLFAAYAVTTLSALLAGAVGHGLSGLIGPLWLWMALCGLIGGVIAVLTMVAGGMLEPRLAEPLRVTAIAGVAGGAASAWFARWGRPRPKRRRRFT